MPQISTILQDEQQNNGACIRLYAEGIFYKAYERSAWVACRVLHPFMVKKRAVRKVVQEVVSIGSILPILMSRKQTAGFTYQYATKFLHRIPERFVGNGLMKG